jgi:chemotaxis protein histidine kinase CheA/ActR/RegA family two-component response regulator
MAIDRNKYIGRFIDEGLENLQTVEMLLIEIKEGISVEEDLVTMLRALHTLKGTARMLEFRRIESLSHALESVFIAFKEQRIGLTDKGVKLVMGSLDMLKAGLAEIKETKDDGIDVSVYEKELAALAANEDFTVIEIEKEEAALAHTRKALSSGDAEDQSGKEGTGDSVSSDNIAESQDKTPLTSKKEKKEKKDAAKQEIVKAESIRISLEKVNAIIKKTASQQSLEIAAKSIAMEVVAINGLVKEYSGLLKADKNHDAALIKEFRKIERLQGKITQTVRNFAIDVGVHTKEVYDSVISLRMLPISTILDTYPRYVYDMSIELEKKIQLTIEGKENEIDKNIIEALQDAFLHMVRNAVDHGIEKPEERKAAGKDETGHLIIRCSRESGQMKIVVSDDGKGIDHEYIRKKAVDTGYVTEPVAASLTKEDLIGFIFQSGFTTASRVNNISGRGVGMDVVRTNIEGLKGSILVDTTKGQGTTFTILVPLSIAALMGFPCTVGEMKFIIPANFVDTIILVDTKDIITVVDRPEIKYQGRIIRLYYLEQVLKIQNLTLQKESAAIFVVIVHVYDDIIALAVDSVDSMRNVILKSVPAFMESMGVFSGIVLSEDYEMIGALNMPSVIKMAKQIKGIDLKKRDFEYKKLRRAILVVDDSLPTREIESEILRAEGYKVDTAADGSEALKAAKNNSYDLICTDLNMPQMDGFMLTENIKKNEKLSAIPIIVISSRESEEDQKRAAILGASRYIVKNSFNNHNLLTAVHELIGAANG